MKADLHVHSYHSGYASHFRRLRARDSYSSPEAVYRTAKARGMDLVCLTDHDSIDGCLEFLDAYPDATDFIMGEEIECAFPDVPDMRVHLGAIGMTERQHREVQRLRPNALDVAAFLRDERVFFAVNHLFFFYRASHLPLADYLGRVLRLAPAVEIHNGAMLPAHNRLSAELRAEAARRGRSLAVTGGSDAHTLQWVGTSFTEADGATREEFLAHVRSGRARVGGVHGTLGRMTSEVYGVILNYWRSLVGLERSDLGLKDHFVSTACTLALCVPAVVVPGIVAVTHKAREARRVRECREAWASDQSMPITPGATAALTGK
ncbi:MAG: PHP domain-containing protein [Acidobacteriota bacterium]